ncbi:hypothetical protein ACFL6H_09750 [Candidatus Latescibacterota bacterium]
MTIRRRYDLKLLDDIQADAMNGYKKFGMLLKQFIRVFNSKNVPEDIPEKPINEIVNEICKPEHQAKEETNGSLKI